MGDVQSLTNLAAGITEDQTANFLAKISKELAYLLNNLDSLNVTSIDTSITTITSEGGTIVLDGGQMTMFDAAGVLRFEVGTGSDDVFDFTLYDDTGTATITIDSSGKIHIGSGDGVANLDDSGALAVLDSVDFDVAGQVLNAGDLATLNSISSTYLDSDSVTTPKIAAGSIITAKLAAGAVTATEIAANAVTASKINVSELSAISADIGSITSGTITGATIRTASSGERIELSGSTFTMYNSTGQRDGIYMNDGASNYMDWYHNGDRELRMSSVSNGFLMASDNGDSSITISNTGIGIGSVGSVGVIASGDWDFSSATITMDETDLDFSNESRSWFENNLITTPYYGSGNYCYVDTDGTNVVFRDDGGNTVATI